MTWWHLIWSVHDINVFMKCMILWIGRFYELALPYPVCLSPHSPSPSPPYLLASLLPSPAHPLLWLSITLSSLTRKVPSHFSLSPFTLLAYLPLPSLSISLSPLTIALFLSWVTVGCSLGWWLGSDISYLWNCSGISRTAQPGIGFVCCIFKRAW